MQARSYQCTCVRGPNSRYECHLGEVGEKSLHGLAVCGHGTEGWGYLHWGIWGVGRQGGGEGRGGVNKGVGRGREGEGMGWGGNTQ